MVTLPFLLDKKDYAIENLLADVAALIDAAECEETILLAHDWGAVIAWYFSIREVRPLSKLVICNVPHPAASFEAGKLGPTEEILVYLSFSRFPDYLSGLLVDVETRWER